VRVEADPRVFGGGGRFLEEDHRQRSERITEVRPRPPG